VQIGDRTVGVLQYAPGLPLEQHLTAIFPGTDRDKASSGTAAAGQAFSPFMGSVATYPALRAQKRHKPMKGGTEPMKRGAEPMKGGTEPMKRGLA
jgi:hypothetical protein